VVQLARLRFPDASLERAFLKEYAHLERWRYLLGWGLSAPIAVAVRFILMGTPEEIRVGARVLDVVVLPTILAMFAFGLAPRAIFLRGWQAIYVFGCAVGPASVGVIALVVTRSEAQVSPRFVDFGAGFMGLFIISVCTTASLRTAHAAVATVAPAAFFLTVVGTSRACSRADLAITGCFTLYGLMFGLGGCYQIERLRRAEFLRRHELAEEREKTERLLKHEISHQVAERSKQLGEELARFDTPANGVTIAPGDCFDGRYRVIRALGTGGMGAVYEVERLTDEQRFALKVITGRVTGVVAARFAREAEIGARLQHPNLVSIVDVGVSHSGGPFLVMDLVLGGTLEDRSSRFGDIAWAKSMLRQVADGLLALHDAGVVHRDLKPGNILLQGGAEDEEVARISDYGISRVVVVEGSVDVMSATQKASSPGTARLTGTGTLLGTPLYMAPESAHGARVVDAPSDVFAFGVLAYEMLTARPPFQLPLVLLALAKQPLPAPEPMRMPDADAVSRCVLQCLVADPARRPTMREVRQALG
jgi:hypothetical protein